MVLLFSGLALALVCIGCGEDKTPHSAFTREEAGGGLVTIGHSTVIAVDFSLPSTLSSLSSLVEGVRVGLRVGL